jgi:arylsulfatase A-like enzyme
MEWNTNIFFRRIIQHYNAATTYMDDQVGHILQVILNILYSTNIML